MIGINLISIDLKRKTGVENVCYNLLKYMSIIDNSIKYKVFVLKDYIQYLPPLGDNYDLVIVPRPFNLSNRVIEQTIFLKYLYSSNLSTLFCPGSNNVFLYFKKSVIYIHDIYSVLFRKQVTIINWLFQILTIYQSRILGRVIVTVSNNTRNDLIKLGFDPSRAIVVYNGINTNFIECNLNNNNRQKAVQKKYNLPDKYFLYVGTIQPLKNVLSIVKVFEYLKKKHCDYRLVIVGAKGWKNDKLFNYISRNELKNDIRFCGYVDDGDLPFIYKASTALFLLSLYEGFGLPLIESMYVGTPVIGSNRGSIPEILANDEFIFEPYDITAISNKVDELLVDDSKYKITSELCINRAKYFSWDVAAKKIINIITQGFQP